MLKIYSTQYIVYMTIKEINMTMIYLLNCLIDIYNFIFNTNNF